MAAAGGALTVVQVTGFHLSADDARVNAGLLPAARGAAVLAAASAAAPAPDAVVLTGDFTNDDSEASYVAAKRLVRAAWPAPTRVLFVPGNHEDVAALERVFCPEFTGPAGDCTLASAPLGPGWRAVLLSTFLGAGAVAGGVAAPTYAALEAAFAAAAAAGEHVLLALHHPPLPPAGEVPPWAGNCLREPAPLLAALAAHACVRVALHGHLHADVAMRVGHADVYCTPSTCTQTLVASPTWQKDTAAQPGFRLLRLLPDGGHATEVRRVDIAHCKRDDAGAVA